MKYKAVIFDLDGTLVDTNKEYRYLVVGRTVEYLNKKTTNDDIDRFWFSGNRDEIIKERFKLEPVEFWNNFKIFDKAELRIKYTKPYDDIGFIDELRQNGFKTGIVTGAPVHIADLEIGLIGENKFDSIVIAHNHNGYKQKPHPHGLINCLDQLNINNSEAIYVGNADEDIGTAINANVLDVLILRGDYEFPHLRPSKSICSLHELRSILEF